MHLNVEATPPVLQCDADVVKRSHVVVGQLCHEGGEFIPVNHARTITAHQALSHELYSGLMHTGPFVCAVLPVLFPRAGSWGMRPAIPPRPARCHRCRPGV